MQNELALGTCLQTLFLVGHISCKEKDWVPERWQGWRAGKKQSLTLPALCDQSQWHWEPWVPLYRGIPHRHSFLRKWVKTSRANGWRRMSCTSLPLCFLPLAVSTLWPWPATTSSLPLLAIDEKEHCTVSLLESHVSKIYVKTFISSSTVISRL